MLIDTHVHLDFKEFDSDREQVIKRAFDSGIEKIINIGCNLERSKNSIELALKYDQIYATVGIHPQDVIKYELKNLKFELSKLAKENKVVAIGECGLDYYRLENEAEKERQREFFKLQLDLAKNLNLPVIIHCRNAFDDLLKILKPYSSKLKAGGVTHCFSGTLNYAQEFLKLGFLISFTGSITYAKPQGELLKVVKMVPLDKILVETDCPYLAPVPHRGERNEPAYLRLVVEKIAQLKGIKFKQIANQTTENAKKLFKL